MSTFRDTLGRVRWSAQKDSWLREHRGVSFREIVAAVLSENLMDIIENPARRGQQALVVRLKDYIWVVPFVLEAGESIFLKTAYPSRKMNARYGGSYEAKGSSR